MLFVIEISVSCCAMFVNSLLEAWVSLKLSSIYFSTPKTCENILAKYITYSTSDEI